MASLTKTTPLLNKKDICPVDTLIPAEETGVVNLKNICPEYDGRNIRVAVFDTGVDPSALHLHMTSHGLPKIIDIVDTTGGGDVDMKHIAKIDEEGNIKLLSGRLLKIPEEWARDTSEFRLGIKPAYSIFPKPLIDRLKKKRGEDRAKIARGLLAEVEKQLLDAKSEENKNTKLIKDLEERIAHLSSNITSYEDMGPVFDCISFHNGTEWMAAVIDESIMDLSSVNLMSDYKNRQEFGIFSEEDHLAYGFKFYNSGDILSIVTPSGSHGTHVAATLAAYDSTAPLHCGIAPGAQIVSVKIGDVRINGMETGAGIIRGVAAAVENKCHLINMSYGEATTIPNAGEIVRALQDVVRKENITFVGSASNSGPALSTVGCPGGVSSALIGVGAYASKALMDSSYALPQAVPDVQYTWSSRGPAFDGSLGVCVSAPGGAIADIPSYSLQGTQLMNGTSMSSPNLCGGVACLLSALVKEGIPWTPFSIRRSLENTAICLSTSSLLDGGHGIAQLDKSFELLNQHRDDMAFFPEYEVDVSYLSKSGRGVYLRDDCHFRESYITAAISVSPKFHEKTPKDTLITFERELSLVCKESWVKVASFLHINNSKRHFNAIVDTSSLEPGLHVTEIRAYDSFVDAGPVFRIPITICKPSIFPSVDGKVAYSGVASATTPMRKYFAVPAGVTAATINFTPKGFEGTRRFVLHALQTVHNRSFSESELYLEAGAGLEICLAQWWSTAGTSDVDITLQFEGANIRGNLCLTGTGRIDVDCNLGNVIVNPKATYDTLRRTVYPDSVGNIRCLQDKRNAMLDGKQMYGLELTYPFSLHEKATVYPELQNISAFLYESDMENQLWSILDENKRPLQWGDAFPTRYKKEFPKGSYTLVYQRILFSREQTNLYALIIEMIVAYRNIRQLRHRNKAKLEALKESPVFLHQKLKSNIQAKVLSGPPGTTVDKSFKQKTLSSGSTIPLYIDAIPTSKLPKDASSGDSIEGTFYIDKDSKDVHWPICSVVAKGKIKAQPKDKEPRPVYSDFQDDDETLDEIASNFLDNLEIQTAVLKCKSSFVTKKVDLLEAIDNTLALIDEDALLKYFAQNHAEEDVTEHEREARDKEKEKMNTSKTKLFELLLLKVECALEDATEKDDTLTNTIQKAKSWQKLSSESEWAIPLARYYLHRQEFGRALQSLSQCTSKEGYLLRNDIYKQLGWSSVFNTRDEHILFPQATPLMVE
eukprot:gene4304-6614_t